MVDNGSRFDDHAPPTYEITRGFKPFTINVVNAAQSGYDYYIKECIFFFFPFSRSMGTEWRCVTILVGISKYPFNRRS